MGRAAQQRIAIVDYGMGNLFSVMHACNHVGVKPVITSAKGEIVSSDAVILPGVGAFGRAMELLRALDLVETLRELANSSKPLVGVCLGMQLLMTESFEFGRHEGLGIIKGRVNRFQDPVEGSRTLKVPQVGWNRIQATSSWMDTPLNGLHNGEHMYFVHSYIVEPEDQSVVLSTSKYGQVTFCSTLMLENVFGCQYHPERSGQAGLRIYNNLKTWLQSVS